MIDKKSPIPVYYQLKNLIEKDIKSGVLKPGDSIKTEMEYCEEFKISRMTVRQALKELENDGLILRERGRGSFVSHLKIEQEGLMSFTDMAKNKNMVPSTTVVSFNKIKAESIAEKLNLNPEEDIYQLIRIRNADNIPIAVEKVYLPVKMVPGFEIKDLTGSLYKILTEDYDITILSSKTSFSSVMASDELKEQLEIFEDMPLLQLENICYSPKLVYYELSYYRSDYFKITVNLNK